MKQKVLIFSEYSDYGGTRTYLLKLLEYYHNNNYDVKLCSDNSGSDDEFKDRLTKLNVKYHKLPGRPKSFRQIFYLTPLSLILDVVQAIYPILKYQPDIIIVSVGTPGLYIGIITLSNKFLYILHTVPVKNFQGKILSSFLKLFLNEKRKFLTVSKYAKSQIIDMWNLRSKNKYVFSLPHYIEKSLKKRKVFNKNVITAGHLESYKNPFIWIEVCRNISKSHPNSKFIWYGDGSLFNKCIQMVKNDNNIMFVGKTNNLINKFDKASIYFQPSLVESFGLSVLESLSHGLVPVISSAGGLPEIVNSSFGYICDPNDVDCYVKSINNLLNKPEELKKKSILAKRHSSEFFNVDEWYDRMNYIHSEFQ